MTYIDEYIQDLEEICAEVTPRMRKKIKNLIKKLRYHNHLFDTALVIREALAYHNVGAILLQLTVTARENIYHIEVGDIKDNSFSSRGRGDTIEKALNNAGYQTRTCVASDS